MRRNMALIRKILLRLESASINFSAMDGFIAELKLDDFTPEEIAYHAYLVIDGGYAECLEGFDNGEYFKRYDYLTRLTFKGHDFAEMVRDDDTWQRARDWIERETGQPETSTEVLIALIRKLQGTRFTA